MKFHLSSQILLENEPADLISDFPELNVYHLQDAAQAGQGACIFVEENLEPNQVVAAFKTGNLRHLVQKNKGHFEKSLSSAGRLLRAGSDYFKSDYCFPDEVPLRSISVPFKDRSDKDQLKKKSSQFTEEIQSTAVSDACDAIVEELYMNAIIDAPREAGKKGWNIAGGEAEMFFCQTPGWLQISCTDPFGSLDVSKFISRMQEVYVRGAGAAINLESGGGAGLGCVILFEHSTCLILGVQPGQKTKVTCLIPLWVSNRQRAEMKKSLHWFEV